MLVMHTADRLLRRCAHTRKNFARRASFPSLFGSVARGETGMDSDIDLAAEFDPAARMDLLQLSAVEGASPSYLAVRWTFCLNR